MKKQNNLGFEAERNRRLKETQRCIGLQGLITREKTMMVTRAAAQGGWWNPDTSMVSYVVIGVTIAQLISSNMLEREHGVANCILTWLYTSSTLSY